MARRGIAATTILVLGIFGAVSAATGQAPGGNAAPLAGNESLDAPGLTKDRGGLASGLLRQTVTRLQSGRSAPAGIDVVGSNGVRVEILHSLSATALEVTVARLGGSRLRSIGATAAEAVLPVSELEALESAAGVSFVRPPLRAAAPQDASFKPAALVGQHVTKTNAGTWHARGLRGDGVRIGIIDGFSAPHWNAAIQSGDLPNPAGAFCVSNGSPCDIWASGSTHGVGVAEIVHDMAPGASLYIASSGPTGSAADLQAIVNYFASQGVRIITRSQAAWYDGPGNGTGPIAGVIENAVSRGMNWFNSAGNSAGGGTDPGGYWRGTWQDANSNGWIDFAPTDELMGMYCGFTLGLRWSDWGPAPTRTDYDLYIYDDPGATVLEAQSLNNQPGGALPLEHVDHTCDAAADVDFMAIRLYPGSGGTAGDTLEFMMNSAGIEYWQNEHSATQPASDTASAGGLSIGAIEPWDGATIAGYSSQGPSNDGRFKPDLAAASCLSTATPTTRGCFDGTSAATPVAAGAAALYVGATPGATPAQVRSFLLSQAYVDRGTPGPDNVFGGGEIVLPALPAPETPRTPAGADRTRPTARALPARGRRGRIVRLRYRVFDNTGTTRELVTVRRRAKVVRRFRTRFGPTGARGRVYFVRWRAPRRGAGPWRFCVRAWDRTGNQSRLSCARIRLSP
jgi:Subtilase family